MSEEQGDQFIFKSNMTFLDENPGSGALLFRADAEAKNGYIASVDAFKDTIKLVKLQNGISTVLAKQTKKLIRANHIK